MTSSIHLLLKLAAVLVCAAGLVSCAARPGAVLLHPVPAAVGVGTPVNVLVATTRKRSQTDPRDFTDKRNFGLSYEQYTISIPPNHVVGAIEWPERPPGDPARNFVVTKSRALDETSFRGAVFPPGKSGDVFVFVHGYNTNYQEAVYRAAQLSKDNGSSDPVLAFAWPSTGTLTGYVTDREASTYSRDYFEQFLNELAVTPGVRRIHLLAHSMGNWLTVETLRQARLRGKSAFLPKIGEVFLMSPDIDVDVFRTQLDVIGKLNQPITIGVSSDDRALGASQRLAGDVSRVGNAVLDSPEAQAAIKRYGLRVIDLSGNTSLDSMNHSKFVSILPSLREVTQHDAMIARGNPVSRTGLFVIDTAGSILQAPLRLGEAITGR